MEHTLNINKLKWLDFYTYIEFNADGFEKIYTKHIHKFKRNEDLQFDEKPIGNFIVEILNNYNKIINIINECEDVIYKAKKDTIYNERILRKKLKRKSISEFNKQKELLKIEFNNTCIKEILNLKVKFHEISEQLLILDSFIEQYIVHFEETYSKIHNEYIAKLQTIKNKYPKNAKIPKNIEFVNADSGRRLRTMKTKRAMEKIELKNKLDRDYKLLIKKLRIIEESTYMTDKYLRVTATIKSHLEDIMQSIDVAFIHDMGTRNNKFSGIHATLPVVSIEYETEYVKYPQPIKYTYRFGSLRELATITIYQLSLNHKVIIKCKNCGKYLVPDRTDRQYCDENCKWRFMTRKSLENSSKAYEHYRKLYNRYKNNKNFKKEFEELKNMYYSQYKENLINDETFDKMLNEFDIKVRKNHSVKRGRPKKINN